VGTSNAFGGSRNWKEVVSSSSDAGTGSGSDWAPSQAFSQAFGKALGRGDRKGATYGVSDLLAGSRNGSKSAAGNGREGGAAPTFTRQAARGALVLAAVDAIETGDQAALVELGLDATDLAGLMGRDLFVALIDLILGPASHPDDQAVAQSVLATLSSAPVGASLKDRVANFVSALAWQLAAVQLTASTDIRSRVRGAIRSLETKVKRWISGKVNRIAPNLASQTPQVVAAYASTLAAKACAAFIDGGV
jgi:hypothetical protein